MPPPPPTTDSAIAAAIAAGTRIATPEARSAWRIQDRTTKWTVAGCRRDTLRIVGRLSIARSMRVALLGLALVLAVVAGLGVAQLYSARQAYEDRLANGYGLQASAGRLLAAGVVAEASRSTPQGAQAQRAFETELAQARRLAHGDPRSEQLVVRASGGGTAARAAAAALSARQNQRIADARRTARHDTRVAVAVIVAGGVLALAGGARARGRAGELAQAPARRARRGDGAPCGRRPRRPRARGRALGAARARGVVQRDGGGPRVRDAPDRGRARAAGHDDPVADDGLLVVGADGSVEHANERARYLLPDPSVLPPVDGGARAGGHAGARRPHAGAHRSAAGRRRRRSSGRCATPPSALGWSD